ncbi:hypothetical protein H8D57_03980 [bacterium]|nr:hypothetical protein [bacterium]
MEGYGLLSAAISFNRPPYTFIAKAVSDDGVNKSDDFQVYASYVSAKFVQNFLKSTSLWHEGEEI